LWIATHAATKHCNALYLGVFVEAHVASEARGIAANFTEWLNYNGSAKSRDVTVYVAADMYAAAETGDLRHLLVGTHEDVAPELRSVVRAIGKSWKAKRCDAQKADHEPE
jgi:hypothetical protein